MKLLIDADGCPVVDNAVRLAKRYGVEVLILCDTAHVFEKDGAQTITVSKGADSVDYALVNRVSPGDLVVTQDYGLAAMCLAKRAIPLNQNGLVYTNDNIDALLLFRHAAREICNAGGRLKGNAKRNRKEQDAAFEAALEQLIRQEKQTTP